MFYFMCFIVLLCLFNLSVMVFIVWKFGIDVFFMNEKEPSKETTSEPHLNRSQ